MKIEVSVLKERERSLSQDLNMKKYVILTFLIFGCQAHEKSNSSKIFIDLDNVESARYSDFFSKIEYMLLDVPDNMPFVKPWKLVFTQNHILLNDRELGNILIFDKKGNFKKIISSSGRGPHEFSYINDFQADDKRVSILDGSLKKVIHFDLEGNFMQEDFIDLHPRIFSSSRNTGLYYYGNSPDIEDYTLVKKVGLKIEGIKTLNPNFEGINYASILGFQNTYDGKYEYLKLDPSYEIVFFDAEKRINSIIEFDFGKYNFPIEKRKSITFSPERFDFLKNNQIVELIFSFLSLKEIYLMTVNQSGLKTKYIIMDEDFRPSQIIDNIINDLDGLMTDFSPFTVDGDNLVTFKSSLDFLNDYNDSFQNGIGGFKNEDVSNIHDFVKNHTEKLKGDNYVVIKYATL